MTRPKSPDKFPEAPRPKNKRGVRGNRITTKPDDIARRQRNLKCVELRAAGWTWQAIADELGYSHSGHAWESFQLVMKEYPREDIETWRGLISDRHDIMLRALWPDVVQGKWLAIDRATRILEAQAKLHGANRPEKIQVTQGETDLDAALRELEEQMRRRAARDNTPVPQE